MALLTDPNQSGHLFVVRADVTQLSCDAVLVPTDDYCKVEPTWESLTRRVDKPRPWSGDSLVQWASQEDEVRWVAFGRVALDERRGTEVSREQRVDRASQVAVEFIEQAASKLRNSADIGSEFQRRPRVALPLIGTGHGGLGASPGDLLRPLLETLRDGAARTGIDVVLTVIDAVAWSAVQHVRRSGDDGHGLRSGTPAWWNLDSEMVRLSTDLSQHARNEQLVLFIGAGVSRDAGVPDWDGLLESVAGDLGVGAEQYEQWRYLDPRDRARLLERQAEINDVETGFRELVLKHLEKERFGLTHALLASLMVEAAITTNYDTLYEAASRLPKTPKDALAVLPFESVTDGGRWLLKMHGDRERADIVITRADYLRLNRHGGALFGIVQAMLVTRHLLFIGYSLSDEDFHALVDEIESAVNPDEKNKASAARPSLGTALVLEDVAWSDLWKGTIKVERVGTSSEVGENARTLQIVLDRVNAYSVDGSAHVLDHRFGALLDQDEKEIVGRLRDVGKQVRALPHDSSLRTALLRALNDLGYGDHWDRS